MRPGPVRKRADFAALRARGVRSRRRPVRVTYLPGGTEVRVAYAIGRPVGTAVRRNRLRRRLRAIVADLSVPSGTYLLAAGPDATGLSSTELRSVLTAALLDVSGTER